MKGSLKPMRINPEDDIKLNIVLDGKLIFEYHDGYYVFHADLDKEEKALEVMQKIINIYTDSGEWDGTKLTRML